MCSAGRCQLWVLAPAPGQAKSLSAPRRCSPGPSAGCARRSGSRWRGRRNSRRARENRCRARRDRRAPRPCARGEEFRRARREPRATPPIPPAPIAARRPAPRRVRLKRKPALRQCAARRPVEAAAQRRRWWFQAPRAAWRALLLLPSVERVEQRILFDAGRYFSRRFNFVRTRRRRQPRRRTDTKHVPDEPAERRDHDEDQHIDQAAMTAAFFEGRWLRGIGEHVLVQSVLRKRERPRYHRSALVSSAKHANCFADSAC